MGSFKRSLAMLLAVVMLLTTAPLSVFAAEPAEAEGTLSCGDYRYTLTEEGNAVICGYTGKEKEDLLLRIPASLNGVPVTELGEEAFADNKALTAVVIPENITAIDNAAFCGCENLVAMAFLGEMPGFGFTLAEGSRKLQKIFAPENSDMLALCTALLSDFGEDSKNVALEFYPEDQVLGAFEEYIQPLLTMQTPEKYGDGVVDFDDLVGKGEDTEVEDGDIDIDIDSGIEDWEDPVTTVDQGSCGTGVTWRLESDGRLIISGRGLMDSYTEGTQPWFPYASKIRSIRVGDGVVRIGAYAFYGLENLRGKLLLPSTVTSIGPYAFYMCKGLSGDLVIPDRVVTISGYAFYGCSGFNGILQLSDKLTNLGAYAFYGCSGLKGDLIIPEGVTTIAGHVFEGCSGFDGVLQLPGGAKAIAAYAFFGCSGLKGQLSIPASVTTIGNYAFTGCSGLTGDLILPEYITSIGNSAFAGCSGFNGKLMLPDSLTTISPYAFAGCSGFTGDLVIPDGVTTVAAYSFQVCFGFNGKLMLPANLEDIGIGAFSNCKGFTGDLVIPEGVTVINESAFMDCSGFDGRLQLPSNVEAIGGGAFRKCSGLTGSLVLPSALKTIGNGAFYSCSGFTGSLVIPENVTVIDASAFRKCSGFDGELVIGESVTVIGSRAFADCTGITGTVVIPDGVTELREETFSGSEGITKLVVGSGMEMITTSDSMTDHAISLSGLKEIVFTSEKPPRSTNPTVSIFAYMPALETVTVPAESYKLYVNAYGSQLGENVKLVPDRPLEPQITEISVGNALDKVGVKNVITVSIAQSDNLTDAEGNPAVTKLFYTQNGEKVYIGDAQYNAELSNAGIAVYGISWDITGVADGSYTLVAEVTDCLGITGSATKEVTVDHTVPAIIEGVAAVGDINVIRLRWGISGEVDTTSYRIYRKAEGEEDFVLFTQLDGRNSLTCSDGAAEADTLYYYYITGLNAFGQEGAPSRVVTATLSPDTEAPQIIKLFPVNGTYVHGNVNVSLTAQDNVHVAYNELQFSVDDGATWQSLAVGSGNSLSAKLDTTLLADGVLRLRGIALDGAGNESTPLIYTYRIDNTGPAQVTGLSYESTHMTVTLRWENVADEDVRFFRVERQKEDGSYVFVQDVNNTLGVNLYGFAPLSSATYRVTAYDAQSNRGIPSEPITVTTQADIYAPAVTQLLPASGSYSGDVTVSATARDEYCVAKLALQISVDGETWETLTEKTFDSVSTTAKINYTLSLAAYTRSVRIRAVATDSAGNVSNTGDDAPYARFTPDNTPPQVPTGFTATGINGYVMLQWEQGAELDLGTYDLYRSESPDGEFALRSGGLAALGFIDRSVTPGKTYYYKLAVNDQSGNISAFTEIVSAQIPADVLMPEIVSVYPANDSTIGVGFRSLSALATDNNRLSEVVVEYSTDGQTFNQLRRATGIGRSDCTVSATIPEEVLTHGGQILVRISAVDEAGNVAEPVQLAYTVDALAPEVGETVAYYKDNAVYISWLGKQEEDLAGYRIYRMEGTSGTYTLVGQRQAVEGQADYVLADQSIALRKTSYTYKVEAVDSWGNASFVVTENVQVPDRSAPKAVIQCEPVMAVGAEYYIDGSGSTDDTGIVSYAFDFGDGTRSVERKPVHKYTKTGNYTITLTVVDVDGNIAMASRKVSVKEVDTMGRIKIRVVDQNGSPVVGAPVYFDLGESTQVVRATDGSGYVFFDAITGKHTVGCVIANNEWLPVKKDVIVLEGEETSVAMTMVKHTMIEGYFESKRMTFDEIVAAGIDVTEPANQYMVKVNMHLVYEGVSADDSFVYNGITGEVVTPLKPVKVPGGWRDLIPVPLPSGDPFGGWIPDDDDDDDDGNGGGLPGVPGGSVDGWGDYQFSEDPSFAILDVPIGASALKDFFDVNLHIINNSASEFSMLNNVVTLNLEDGLSIVDTYMSETSNIVHVPEIQGQTRKTIKWILRGDKVDSYLLSANFTGTLSQFNKTISTGFIANEPIEVRGLEGMKMTVEVADQLENGTLYYNVILANDSDREIYRPDITTDDILLETRWYTDTGAYDPEKSEQTAEETLPDDENMENIAGVLDILPPANRIMKLYMCIDQTEYTESVLMLKSALPGYIADYGLEVEFEVKPLEYFVTALNPDEDAVEKAELIFKQGTVNADAYSWIMRDQNFVYWNMEKSFGEGPMSEALKKVSPASEVLWDAIGLVGGNSDLEDLFNMDSDDAAQAILLQAMRLNVEEDNYAMYYMVCDWASALEDTVKDDPNADWYQLIAEWVIDNGKDLAEDKIKERIELLAGSYAEAVDTFAETGKWDFYKILKGGKSTGWDEYFMDLWSDKILAKELDAKVWFDKSEQKKLVRQTQATKEFTDVWESLGVGFDAASAIIDVVKETQVDMKIFLQAEASQDSCLLFLDTILDYSSGGQETIPVKNAARAVKNAIKSKAPILNIAMRILDSAAKLGADFGADMAEEAILARIGLSGSPVVAIIQIAVGITVQALDSIFHVSQRFDIARNIRLVTNMSTAMCRGTEVSYNACGGGVNEELAKTFMRRLMYLIKLRAIGESQVAEFGKSYEVLQGVFDSKPLFKAASAYTGDAHTTSWNQWRDAVEDRINEKRITLLKAPAATDTSSLRAPTVTYDYTTGQTVQSFSGDYRYSLNGGTTWITCDGGPIVVAPQNYEQTLLVQRISGADSERLKASVTIHGTPTLYGTGITLTQSSKGYFVEGLKAGVQYEMVLSHVKLDAVTEDALVISIPLGRTDFTYETAEKYEYVYIRSLKDTVQHDSYLFLPEITIADEPVAVSLKVVTPPVKTKYYIGEQLDTTGLTVAWVYDDGSEELITEGFAVSKLNSSTEGTKTVKVTCGDFTASFKVRVYAPLTVTQQPAAQTVTAGDNAVFTVKAENAKAYLWEYRKPGAEKWIATTMSGYRTDTLTVEAISGRNGYQYRCIITGKDGTEFTSQAAVLTVLPTLRITVQPADTTAAVGRDAVFTVKTNSVPTVYCWQYRAGENADWTTADSAAASLTIPAAECADGMQVRCILTGDNGKVVTSDTATLHLVAMEQPADITCEPDANAVFTVYAADLEVTAYRWQYRRKTGSWFDTALNGFDTDTLTVPAIASRNGYQYRCILTCADGTKITTDSAVLNILLPGAVISRQPVSVTAANGGVAKFSVHAEDAIAYRWQYCRGESGSWFESALEGSNTSILRVPATEARAGYRYRCLVTGKDGVAVESQPAVLYLLEIPETPQDVTVEAGGIATFRVAVKEVAGVAYRWEYARGENSQWYATTMDGYNTPVLSVKATAARNGYRYRCVIVCADGTETATEAAVLTVE